MRRRGRDQAEDRKKNILPRMRLARFKNALQIAARVHKKSRRMPEQAIVRRNRMQARWLSKC